MNDLTYIIPTRIESEDRLKNIITSVTYLLKNIPEAKVIVKEVSDKETFKFRALPEIKKYTSVDNLQYIFEESPADSLFHKTRILNDLIIMAQTSVVCSHDVDAIYPVSSHQRAYELIKQDQADVVYPYGCGVYQWKADYDMDMYNLFTHKLSTDVLDYSKTLSNSTIGWTQFVNRQKYIDSYMMNENFISWGCEDDEFYYRMSILGNRIARIDDYVYHLEHSRTDNSWFSNPNFNNNWNLWNTIKTFDRKQLVEYYEGQEYLKTRRKQLV